MRGFPDRRDRPPEPLVPTPAAAPGSAHVPTYEAMASDELPDIAISANPSPDHPFAAEERAARAHADAGIPFLRWSEYNRLMNDLLRGGAARARDHRDGEE